MAINNPLYELNPIIEIVEPIKNNPNDHNKVSFKVKGDYETVIKWCRRNFGDRGDGWDFFKVGQGLYVEIWSSKLIVMWELWQE